MSDNVNILLVGAGYMAQEYAKVLIAQNRNFTVVGRGIQSAANFKKSIGIDIVTGGVEKYLKNVREDIPKTAIVAVGTEQLKDVMEYLIGCGVNKILLEKPGASITMDIREMNSVAKENGASVFIAYNRRFYASVIEAEKRIMQDGGVTSFSFEFTEWASRLLSTGKGKSVLQYVLWNNSAHVIDLAFHMGGKPKEMACFSTGEGRLEWHPMSSSFAGAGISETGATFSYQANYDAPGRWGVEVLTKTHRYIFSPLEKLQVQDIDNVNVEFADIDDHLDIDFKPGLYLETKSFLDGEMKEKLCTLEEQEADFKLFDRIAGI